MLGGLSVYESQSHWITRELDKLAESIEPGDPHGVEFHASEIFSQRVPPWKGLKPDEARGTIKSVLKVLADARDTARAFACVVHKASFPGRDPMEIAFRTLGTRWGVIRRLADTPFFVDSRASRVIQLADHVAYAVFRRYQAGDAQYFDLVASKFDEEDGVVHGLAHKEIGNPGCMCPACLSRRINESRRS